MSAKKNASTPPPSSEAGLVSVLQKRFEQHPERHPDLTWAAVEKRLVAHPEKVQSLIQMEATGGEPDVIGQDAKTAEVIFCDCSPESPAGRRSLCYDRKALDDRKEHKPAGSALELAAKMGIQILDEAGYRQLQQKGEFDTKTSSWIETPASIRKKGGALFGDRRYGEIFTYHNGASSYYAARGFRGTLRV